MTDTNNHNTGKRLYIVTYGCQMNVRDSEVICGLLKKEGYKIIDDPDSADIVLFNTCSVRQHAEDRVWSALGGIAKLGPHSFARCAGKTVPGGNHTGKKIIGVIGCMAQNYKEKIFEKSPNVDFVVGPQDIDKIPEIIKRIFRGQSPSGTLPSTLFEMKIWETDGEKRPEDIYHTGFYEDKECALVVISEGCSNFCSYCVVPYVRGQHRSRGYKDILREIEEAIDKGITKITLLGQNVNAYKDNDASFVKLVQLVNIVKGLKEFSFLTSHPKDTSVDLFKAMNECEKLKKSLHLPVQSGSDRILKLMNRCYTRKSYLDLIYNYRKIVKGAELSTDIIVGFPTETENDFQDTYNLVKEAGFNGAYIFKYSIRPNTQAANMVDDVIRDEKERRHRLILELQKSISKIKCSHE